jgi:hypothetical protein
MSPPEVTPFCMQEVINYGRQIGESTLKGQV